MTQYDPSTYILPFNTPGITLEDAGGKGANLARLASAGYPVPGGFLITTAAYRAFADCNGLEERIQAALAAHRLDEPAGLERASAEIRALFAAGTMPPELAAPICQAYRAIQSPPVAVRSSATAEDLPDLSFAGQQDTYLNIKGEAPLLKAVIDCWASLWTGRAIGYRARQGISQSGLSLAVAVQQMVQSEVSGVLFTANPLTGLRSETVIDATFGLGEALVSGQVEPDQYMVDTAHDRIVHKTLGAKALAIRSNADGGVLATQESAAGLQALPDEQILALAQLGQRVAAEYGAPQDIEWAWAVGSLYLLQSRAITSLFPIPEGLSAEPLDVLFSFGAVQGMLDPVTPLGRDVFRQVGATGARLFGYHFTPETLTVMHTAGERLWVKITTLVRNSTGRSAIRYALSVVEPSVGQALDSIWNDPRLLPGKTGISWAGRRRLLRFVPRLGFNVLLNLLAPESRRRMIVEGGERTLAEVQARCAAITGDRRSKLLQRASQIPDLALRELADRFILFVSGVASGMAPFNLLNQLSKQLPKSQNGSGPGWNDLALEVTRGLPHNPTTEMDLLLWETACQIRRDPASAQAFQTLAVPELAVRFKAGSLPPVAQGAIQRFMDRYGERGLAEIDLGRPRWREDPTHILQVLGSYLQIEDADLAPDAVFRHGAERAGQAIDELAKGLRKTRFGWFKARLARLAASRVRALLGMREAPKFFAVRLFGLERREMLASGQEFYEAGELDHADDLLYLTHAELRALARDELAGYRELISTRRAAYNRELLRRQIPRLLLSDGRAFYEGMIGEDKDGGLTGAPVSPGVVEGTVHVILDPRGAQLLPGEIMVCPGTDPSWTPLFLAAGGLVMEVGGMMTHGAVVAREYGIPAVVGVHEATTRLQTGQRIRLDGSSGKITLVE